MATVLHAADLHIDSPLLGLERYEGAPVEKLRGATRRALEALVQHAIDTRVDVVLLAGDLFDRDWKDYGTGLFFNQQMAALRDADIRVVCIRGNHDAASKISRHLRLPANVTMLAHERPETWIDERLGLAIHGRSFATQSETSNLAVGYPVPTKGLVNIGLLHTSVDGREGHENYAPCTIEDLRSKGYNYWALGHVHQAEILCDDPPVLFPGNLQGRHARETGSKGCVRIDYDGAGRIQHAPCSFDLVRWEAVSVDTTGAKNRDDVIETAGEVLRALCDRALAPVIAVRIDLVGSTAAHETLLARWESLVAELRDAARDVSDGRLWIERIRVRTQPETPVVRLEGPFAVLSEVLDELRRDDGLLSELAKSELNELFRRLPHELAERSGGPGLTDLRWVRTQLDRAERRLSRGLLGEGQGE
jgi:DNA repair exonuclease SbcCD nuclease subunit